MLDDPQEPMPPEWSYFTVGDLQRALEGVDPNLPVRITMENPQSWMVEDHLYGVRDLRRINTHIIARQDKQCVDIMVTDADFDLAPDNDLT